MTNKEGLPPVTYPSLSEPSAAVATIAPLTFPSSLTIFVHEPEETPFSSPPQSPNPITALTTSPGSDARVEMSDVPLATPISPQGNLPEPLEVSGTSNPSTDLEGPSVSLPTPPFSFEADIPHSSDSTSPFMSFLPPLAPYPRVGHTFFLPSSRDGAQTIPPPSCLSPSNGECPSSFYYSFYLPFSFSFCLL